MLNQRDAQQRVTVHGTCHRVALVLGTDGGGAPITVDGRGRLRVPAWLRRGDATLLLVGTNAVTPTVLLAAATVLDGLGDVLVGEFR